MIVAHRIALDPNNEQATYFAKGCGTARFAYNWALAEWTKQYKEGGRPSEAALRRQMNAIKGELFPWMADVTKCAPQSAIMNLGDAFKRFFASCKSVKANPGGRRVGYPTFKKKGRHDSFGIDNDKFRVDGHRINIPKLGWVRMTEALRFAGKIMSATVSRTADRWFVSITVEVPDTTPAAREPSVVGIDFGCTTFATLSTGDKIVGPKPHKAELARLKRLNRSLHRKVKGSCNRQRAKTKLARLHARIANVRSDFLHKTTTMLTKRFTTIVVEDLNVAGMAKNHSLARSIMDGSPGELRRQLEYKGKRFGTTIVVADRFFPSSKLCSACGERVAALPLSIRTWACPACGVEHDRDVNAAVNLMNLAASSAVKACGAVGSGGGRNGTVKPAAMKHEPNAVNSVGIDG